MPTLFFLILDIYAQEKKMKWFDIVIMGILIANVISGLRHGFIKEFFSLAGIVAGLLIASRFYRDVILFENILKNPGLGRAISFALIFFGVVLLMGIIGILVHKVVRIGGMGILNHLGGFVFGFLKGVVIVGIALFFLAKVPFINTIIEKSPVASAILRLFNNIVYFIWSCPETTEYI